MRSASAGEFAQPGNAQAVAELILKYAKNPNLAKEQGKSGRKYLEENFDREILAKDMEQLFLSVLNKSV